jgi:hypothetical protein
VTAVAVLAVVLFGGRLLLVWATWSSCTGEGVRSAVQTIEHLGPPSAVDCTLEKARAAATVPAITTPTDDGSTEPIPGNSGHPGQGATTRAECEAERRAAGADLSACDGLP